MQNTFWTPIDGNYYRVYNGVLKYAPMCSETSIVLTDKEELVEVISAEQLEKINSKLGSSFTVDDF
jgi:DNA mismatch repair protein MutH